MKLRAPLVCSLTAAMVFAVFPPLVSEAGAASISAVPLTPPVSMAQTPALTEEAVRARLAGKLLFLRGFYEGDNLQFDEAGKVEGNPKRTSFSLSAIEVRKVRLSKKKLEIEADRYALHFYGALPYEDVTKPYDKVKISKNPIHITIERQEVVKPKKEKEKKDKKEEAKAKTAAPGAASAKTAAAATPAAPAPAPAAAPAVLLAAKAPEDPNAKTTIVPAHSAMLMYKALDVVFADHVDQRLLASLPDYWRAYFKSEQERREYLPGGGHVEPVSADMTPPRVLNSIDPSSNELAQKFGIAGLTLFHTVVGADGKPQAVTIARPIGFGLDEKAVEAIMKSHFRPAMKNGHAVPSVVDVVVTFRIYSNRTKPGSVPKGAKPTVLAAQSADQMQSAQKNAKKRE